MVGAQIAIIFVGGAAFEITPIDGVQWAICVVVAVMCLPWAVLVRLFPDALFAKIAGIAGRPFVVTYRFLGTVFKKIGRLFKRKSIAKEPESRLEENISPERESSCPDIIVSESVSNSPTMIGHASTNQPSISIQQMDSNPPIQVQDIESGQR